MHRSQFIKELADHIASLVRPHPVRVAIDGVDAAGKTTLSDELVQPLAGFGRQVIRASIDGFHNPRNVRYQRGKDSPDGYYWDSFNYQSMVSLLLEPLGPGGSLKYQAAVFDFRRDSPVDAPVQRASADAILLFDGVFLLRPELFDHWDFTVFVDVSFEVSVARASQRDQFLFGRAENVQERYWKRYVPGQRLYMSNCRPRKRADVIVNNTDPENPTWQIA